MRFPDSFLEEIRARLPISQVVGRHVQWDRKRSHPSRGDYWACCPFHHEKTPSFHVDDRKGYYYCFGCHAKGDHFRFLREKEGLSFAEAVARLAQEAGLALPEPDPERERREKRRLSLMELLEEAAGFYERQLASPAGAGARAYAQRRGLSPQSIAKFRIGAAPDARDALYRHLKKKGAQDAEMAEAGLVVIPEDGGRPYDRFRNRLMFPIRDARSRVIAFGGRALGEARAKYLNSPETPLFHKAQVLYNLDQARQSAFEKGEIIAVEGYTDVIALDQAGFANAVAPLGTALTEAQLFMLWRSAAQPVLCFDGDEAGLKAAWRALQLALPHLQPGHSLKFAFLPEGSDPDDLLREQGAGALSEVIERAEPLIDFLFRHLSTARPLTTPEEKAALQARLEEMAGRIREPRVRRHYRDELRERLRALFGRSPSRHRSLRAAGGWGRTRFSLQPPSPRLKRQAGGTGPLGPLPEQDLLRMLLLRPELAPDVGEELAAFPFSAPTLDSLGRVILDTVAALSAQEEADALTAELLLARLRSGSAAGGVRRLMTPDPRRRLRWFCRLPAEEAKAAFLARLHEMRRLRLLQQELVAAEAALAREQTEENLRRLQQVRAELDALRQAGVD